MNMKAGTAYKIFGILLIIKVLIISFNHLVGGIEPGNSSVMWVLLLAIILLSINNDEGNNQTSN